MRLICREFGHRGSASWIAYPASGEVIDAVLRDRLAPNLVR
jgi:hypothetical protein